MMKQLIRYTALLCFMLLFKSCEQDTGVSEATTPMSSAADHFKIKTVTAKQVPEITRFLETHTKGALFGKDTLAGAVFDTHNILEVIDTLNNASYSFRFAYPDTPENIFYNLVVNADSTGMPQTPYIVKYECDPAHFQDFKNNGYQFRFFRGAVKLHPFSHYFGTGDLFNQTDPECVQYDQYGDPIPCLQTHVGSGGSGGGDPGTGFPTGNTTSGTNNSGGGGTGGYDITLTCTCVGHTENEIEAGVCTCPTFILTVNGSAGGANKGLKSTDCPPCSLPGGSSGVNTYPTAVNQLNLILGNELTAEQLDWLENNADTVQELNDFLEEQNYVEEAKNYALITVDAMVENNYTNLFNLPLFNQDSYSVWRTLTEAEKNLIRIYPFKAYKIFKNRDIAVSEILSRFGNIPENLNGKPDAFRHAFFQAINARDVGVNVAGYFADAHETEVPQIWALETEMDLFNNEFGLLTGFDNPEANNYTISNIINQAVLDGDLRYLKPIDYSGSSVPGSSYWDNPNTIAPGDGDHGISNATQLTPTNQ